MLRSPSRCLTSRTTYSQVTDEEVHEMNSKRYGIKSEKAFRGLVGTGALVIWCDVDPDDDEEVNNWYTHQHLTERVGIPGFLRGRRYISSAGTRHRHGSNYFALYETEASETLASEPYLLRLNTPTDWTARMTPRLRNVRRTVCRLALSLGEGIGGFAGTIEFSPENRRESELREWLRATGMPHSLTQRSDLTGIHLLESDEASTRAKDQTIEGGSAGPQAPIAGWVLIVEGMFDDAVEAACANLSAAMSAHGAADDVVVNLYQLLVSISE